MLRRHLPISERGSTHIKAQKSWRDSPLIIAISSATATMVFMATVVMPIHNAYLTNRLADVADKAARIDELEIARNKAIDQLSKTRGELYALIEKNLFTLGSPYPNGLQDVRLGDNIEKIKDVFPKLAIRKPEYGDYYSIDIEHPVFSSVGYYYDSDKNNKVSMILYQLSYKKDRGNMLEVALTNALGDPIIGKRRSNRTWKTKKDIDASMTEDTSFVIAKAGYFN